MRLPVCLLSLLLLGLSPPVRAVVDLCLEIRAPAEHRQGLRRLAEDELAHHPTHRLVTSGCQSYLLLQLFRLEGVWYLTARINREVPVRHHLDDLRQLDRLLRSSVGQVLGHDPVFLADDITHYSAVQRAAHSVLKRGHNYWRLELFQGLGRGSGSLALAPGGAVSLTRGADHWQVFVRVFAAGWPGRPSGREMVLAIHTGAEGGLTYEFSEQGWATFYLSAGLGLEYRRYSGLLDAADENSLDYRNDFGPALTLRAGVRLLRFYSFDCDLFVLGRIPLYPADKDTLLDTFYPLDLQVGVGVGF
ncbi:MAG: hypothetical protein DRI34_05830 [Deltaproteobacteria bacterium]|nr:MAG: hypothetical protein DRI34_05830 [Deltaproteobacteria bacterium]